MRSNSVFLYAPLSLCLIFFGMPSDASAQQPSPVLIAAADAPPETPRPQFALAVADSADTKTPSSTPQGASSSQTPIAQASGEKSQQQKAQEQIKEQEQQRVLGILPNFNISYRSDAVSLTAKQKLSLAFHSATDPVNFAIPFFVAGYHEAKDDDKGFGWGLEGYGKRTGAAYLDSFTGNIIGNGALPALLHQDPRYFRRGHGTFSRRLVYSLATNVICKHDNTGKWEPNYSNVLGNIAGGAISNLYYPSSDTGFGLAISNGLLVTAEGGLGSIFDEFWPDVARKLLHKDPTHGLDAQIRAADKASRQAARN